MAKYALLELNLDDASFTATANAPFSGSGEEDSDEIPDADDGEETDTAGAVVEDDDDGGPGLVPVLVALVVLLALRRSRAGASATNRIRSSTDGWKDLFRQRCWIRVWVSTGASGQ